MVGNVCFYEQLILKTHYGCRDVAHSELSIMPVRTVNIILFNIFETEKSCTSIGVHIRERCSGGARQLYAGITCAVEN